MLDNARIHLMCELALYEKHHERDVFEVNKYFKYDFIIWHILLAFLRYTVCAAILAVIVVFFRSDVLFYNINISGLQATFRTAAWYYCIGLAVYLCIAGAVSVVRYQRARNGMSVYASMLRQLLKGDSEKATVRNDAINVPRENAKDVEIKPVEDFLIDTESSDAVSILDEPFIDISIVNEIRMESYREDSLADTGLYMADAATQNAETSAEESKQKSKSSKASPGRHVKARHAEKQHGNEEGET